MENNLSFRYKLSSKWRSFKYNYGWSNYVPYIDGWIPKFAFFFPIIGYLILFNDSISDYFTFKNLTDMEILKTGINGETRLRLLYFGLLFLGTSNWIYKLTKPFVFRLGSDALEYAQAGLEHFTLMDYANINGRIQSKGHESLDGKVHAGEWDEFKQAANGSELGNSLSMTDRNWAEAKEKHGSLLRSMLRDEFYFRSKTNKVQLTICIILSTLGYVFLIIPSIDIFIKVLRSILVF